MQQSAGNAAVSRLIQREGAGEGKGRSDWLDGEANDVHNAFLASELQGVARLNGYSLEDMKKILERFPEHDRKRLDAVLRDRQVQATCDAPRMQLALRSVEGGDGWHAERAAEVHGFIRGESWVEAFQLLNGLADADAYPDLRKVLELLAPAHLRALLVHLDEAQGVDRTHLEARMKEVAGGGPKGVDPSKSASQAFADLALDAVPGATYAMAIKTARSAPLGHVWIEVAEKQFPYRDESCGFFPAGGDEGFSVGEVENAFLVGPGKMVHPDPHEAAGDMDAKREKEIDADALVLVAGVVGKYEGRPYGLLGRNCGDFAAEAWLMGTGESLGEEDPLIQLSIPREVGDKLRSMNKRDEPGDR